MKVLNASVVVCGGASGLGLATVESLVGLGARVTVVDLPTSPGPEVVERFDGAAHFVPADVTEADQVADALAQARSFGGAIRGIVHTAGRGARIRLVGKDGKPGELAAFEQVIRLNVIGSYNILRLGAAAMMQDGPTDGERGAIVLTASVAAFEGQIGQIAYAGAKAAVVGMTLPAARDLASSAIRVCTIAPGVFDTPLVRSVLRPDITESLERSVPFPKRLGRSDEFARMAVHVLQNEYLNGTSLRLDGAIRMAPR